MTLDRPWFLGLAVVALVIWLLRRRQERTEVVVASVLPFRAEPGVAAHAAPRRRADLGVAAATLSALLLAVAASGPRTAATQRTVLVLMDRTAALDLACTGRPDEPLETGRENALGAARSLAAAAGAVVEVVAFGDAAGSTGADGRAALASAEVRARGAASALVVTDRALPWPLLTVLPSHPPAADAWITDVVMDGPAGGESLAVGVVSMLPGPVEATVRSELGAAARVTLVPGARVAVRLPPSATPVARSGTGSETVLSLDLPAAIDGAPLRARGLGRRVVVRRPRVVSKVHIDGFSSGSALYDVLIVAGLAGTAHRAETADAAVVSLRVGGPLPRPGDGTDAGIVVFAPAPGAAVGTSLVVVAVGGAGGTVRGSDVLGSSVRPAVALPAPGTRLAAATRIQGGVPWLRDSIGTLVAADGRNVVMAIDPGGRGDGFVKDPAFAALVLAAIEHAGGGPDDLEVSGLRPVVGWAASGASTASPLAPYPSASDVASCVRTDGSGGGGLATGLAVLAALLALAAARLSR